MWIRLGRKKPKSMPSVLRGIEAYLRLLMAAGVVLSLVSPQARAAGGSAKPSGAPPLPVPCGGAACTTRGGPTQWSTSGSVDSPVTNSNTMSIHQNSQSAILNWASFDIANGYSVRFDQPNADAVVLNKIFQGAPSKIFGSLIANGNVFIVNTNGILFGAGSQVNLHGLIASSLDISDDVFNKGILKAIESSNPAFDSTAAIEAAKTQEGGYKQVNAGITVEQGASISAISGGYVRLFGPDVTNRGNISAPDGQVILAAGESIYLYTKDDPNLRGVFVELGGTLKDVGGGVVSNAASGAITAARGNITLQGSMVNQSGRLTATTSVNANGSIRLVATDMARVSSGSTQPSALEAGSVTLGTGSVTEVLPALQDATTSVDDPAQPFKHSQVMVLGHDITMESGSTIHAASGDVMLTATGDPAATSAVDASSPGSARVYLGAGSSVDVSGTTGTLLAMDHNAVDVELRGVQLADSPLQRDGVVSGQKVTIDARTGSTLANVSGAIAGIQKNVGEHTASGGTVTVQSQGDVLTQAGSSIDVSGGKVTYQGGYVNTSKLIGNDGKIYDIGSASPERTYVGILGQYTQTNRKWGQVKTWSNAALRGSYEQGYTQGADAGAINIQATGAVLDGTLLGHTEAGVLQRAPHRDPANSRRDAFGSVLADPYSAPQGGQLIIGDSASEGKLTNARDFLTPAIDITAHATPMTLDSHASSQNGKTVYLGADALAQSGLARIDLYSNGKITVHDDVDLHLAPGGEIKLVGTQLDVQGSMHTPGGAITLKTMVVRGFNPANHNLQLGAHAQVDTHGLWVNDAPGVAGANTAVTVINGGSITVSSAGDLTLPGGSLLDTGGGAWLQTNGKVKNGNGGSINIATSDGETGHTLQLDAQLLGDAPGTGGALKVTANTVRIDHDTTVTPAATTVPELLLTPEFFQRGGFGSYSVKANLGGLAIAPDTVIAPQAQTRVLDTAAKQQASGSDVRAFSQMAVLPTEQRKAVDLSFAVDVTNQPKLNTLYVGAGAQVKTEAGGKITLTSSDRVAIDGALVAPHGTITVSVIPNDQKFYDPTQGIALGAHALLAATGATIYQPNAQGQLTGAVLDAGSVALNAGSGYVAMATGSNIDVSAVAAPLDLPVDAAGHVVRTTLSGKAGSVDISASEGMVLNGAIDAHAAPGQGAQGGVLALTLSTNRDPNKADDPINQSFPSTPREIVLQANNIAPPPDVDPTVGLGAEQNGQAIINLSSIDASGITQFIAHSADAIRFDGYVQLHTERSVQLDAPVLSASNGANVQISSAYVALGNAQPLQTFLVGSGDHSANGGDAQLQIGAQLLDLIGTHATQNIGSLDLRSEGDLRLRGELGGTGPSAQLAGALNTAADVKLHADQIYPTTLTHFTINALKPDSTVIIEAGNGDHPVLSAAGELTINAPNIDQQGVLKAPFGQITLNAAQQLTLAAGSKTSVASEGLTVPFGKTANGKEWTYDLVSTILTFDAPPEKRVNLNGQNVDLNTGAQVDVSGGGDLYAYEFQPGPGGSHDVLLNVNTFAVLPNMHDGVAPVDYQYQYPNDANPGAGLQPGARVYLSGVPGLKADYYTLLPAHYALLDGAFLVKPVPGYQDLMPGQSVHLVDGTPVVAGYLNTVNTTLSDARWSGFAVQPGSVARTYSEFQDRSANAFFAQQAVDNERAVPRLSGDAGTLAIAVQDMLQLNGSLLGKHADGTHGAQLDIAAANISVVNTPDTNETTTVQIRADKLANFGAESVLLGGLRSGEADGSTTVKVIAQTVRIADGVGMQGSEILLAAQNEVTVGHDAQVRATGAPVAGIADTLNFNGDSALVRASNHAQVQIARSDNLGNQGVVNIQSGAVLAATGSMTLDGTNDTRLDGHLEMSGGSLSLGASKIGLGAVPVDQPGLHLFGTQLADLKVDELVLNSHGSIDFFGAQDITTNNLTMSASAVISHDLAQDQTINLHANTLTLANRDHIVAATLATAPPPSGTLNISANTVQLGAGTLTLDGAAHNVITVQQQVVATANGALNSSQDLTINSPRITGTRYADYTVQAAQALALKNLGGLVKPNADELGARLNFIGQSVAVNTLLEAHSGTVTVHADGGRAADPVTVGAGGFIDVSGVTKTYGEVNVHSPGGTVALSSAHGNIDIQAGAKVNVSAPDTGAHAGELDLSAVEGRLLVSSTLMGTAAADQDQAVFHADAQSLGDFAALNAKLNAGGFTGERAFRQRAGDLTVGGAAGVIAHEVRISTDTGAVTIAKTTDSAGNTVAAIAAHGDDTKTQNTNGGYIEIDAYTGLTLGAGALIDAHATGTNARGGKVVLATQKGQIDLTNASGSIDIRGINSSDSSKVKEQGGSMHLRAPVKNGNDVAITKLAASVKGASTISVEPILAPLADGYAGNVTIDNQASNPLNIKNLKRSIDSYMTNVAANLDNIHARLGNDIHITPDLEIKTTGNIDLNADWNFGASDLSWRYGSNQADPGVLTLRAGGNVKLNASLSDGFDGAATSDVWQTSGDSWSYHITAGADLTATDTAAIQSRESLAGRGNVTLAKNKLVRSGTGSIEINAGGDFTLADSSAVIYTVGIAAPPLDDPMASFTGPNGSAYPMHGGDIKLRTQGNISAKRSAQFIADWLTRRNSLNNGKIGTAGTTWYPEFSKFQEGFGALGGGDVSVRAGGRIDNLSVMIPTNGRLAGNPGSTPDPANLNVQGGGNLTVTAGGDIAGGEYLVSKGRGVLRAGGAITDATNGTAPVLALGDATFNVEAHGDATIDSIWSPSLLKLKKFLPKTPYFVDYTARTRVDAVSLTGNTALHGAGDATSAGHTNIDFNTNSQTSTMAPPTLNFTALQGNVDVLKKGNLMLFPSTTGNISLIAQQNVTLGGELILPGLDPRDVPSPITSVSDLKNVKVLDPAFVVLNNPAILLHGCSAQACDTTPVEIVAEMGDVVGNNQRMSIAKPAHVYAGRDIVGLRLQAQNLPRPDAPALLSQHPDWNLGSTTVIAGRDVIDPPNRNANGQVDASSAEIQVAGPGQLYVEAGRNIDLGTSDGLITIGNQKNSALPAQQGSSITAVAGVAHQADYSGFIQRYLVNSSAYSQSLATFMQARGLDTTVTAFEKLGRNDQRALLLDIFFNELRESGRSAAQSSSKQYARGRTAIATLFPQVADAAASYHGDLNLFFSRIYTLDGGDINLLVPGGLVNAGLASLPPGAPVKTPDQKGIVAQAAGSARAYTSGDFLVNQERVFTLKGGDILLWSDHGNIDAGRGAKTAISAPAPTFEIGPTGNLVVHIAGAVQGSGIRAIATDPNAPPGNVDLIAPDGNVNAGDAGIGSAGNLTIAAQHVLGADNIQVGGVSSGVPVVDSGSFASSLSGVGNLANSVTKNTEQALDSVSKSDKAAPIADAALTFLDVEVLSYGDDKKDDKTAP